MNETVNKFLLAQDKDCQDLMQRATFTKNKVKKRRFTIYLAKGIR